MKVNILIISKNNDQKETHNKTKLKESSQENK